MFNVKYWFFSVKHLRARTKVELQHALQSSRKEQRDCLIEVESCIEDNANYHRCLFWSRLQSLFYGITFHIIATCHAHCLPCSVMRASVSEAVDQACHVLSKFVTFDHINDRPSICKITKMEYSVYRQVYWRTQNGHLNILWFIDILAARNIHWLLS